MVRDGECFPIWIDESARWAYEGTWQKEEGMEKWEHDCKRRESKSKQMLHRDWNEMKGHVEVMCFFYQINKCFMMLSICFGIIA